MTDPVRVLLVEDDPAIRGEIEHILHARADLVVAGSFAAGELALAAVEGGLAADVALVDLRLPGMSGIELIRKLKAARPSIEVVVLTMFEDDESLHGALRAGASGYLLKDAAPVDLGEAVLQVSRGGAPMSPTIARRVLFELRDGLKVPDASLTSREREVLELLTKGASYPQIAKCLSVSTSTVQTHIRAIYRKLEVSTKAEATAVAYRRGIVR